MYMFTGIIQAIGKVAVLEPRGADLRVRVAAAGLDLAGLRRGDSVAVSGVCLTAAEPADDGFWADVSGETLSRTAFATLAAGDAVNLEKALTLADRLGGHLVSGHVDGVGTVAECRDEGRSRRLRIRVPAALARYIAGKGSICVDGVSLTVNAVRGAEFEVNVVPHTLHATTLGAYAAGRRVNIEVDIVARYLERLLLGEDAARAGRSAISREFLAEHGYIK